MKPQSLITATLAIILVVAFSLVLALPPAQAAKSFFEQAGSETKYTPGDFKPAPDKMKTRFGALASE